MIKRSSRIALRFLFVAVVVNVFLAGLTHVSSRVTTTDKAIFESLLRLERPNHPLTFDEEITLLREVQRQVLNKAPVGAQIPEYSEREPEDLFKQGSGLCFDRARTYDKVFLFLGFETRHVYILYPEHPETRIRLPYWQAMFVKGTGSHAVTEVRTRKGWIVVDSNSDWISLSRDQLPIDADGIPALADKFEHIPWYFNRPYLAIRGMYSRRGHFYRPYVPYPEFNWSDFFSWMVETCCTTGQ